MLRRLTVLTLALGLLAGACGDDDAGDDNAAVTSLPDDDTTTTTSTTEPRTVAPDVIPQDESLITEDYVEGVLDGFAESSLDAFLATRNAGVADERAIAIVNATTTDSYAVERINSLTELARNGFDRFHANPGPVRFEVQELVIGTPKCLVVAVEVDSSAFTIDQPADPPPGRTLIELVPASEEQRMTRLNPTAWVVNSIPVVATGETTPDCGSGS